jgi:uncharacterized membrane protein
MAFPPNPIPTHPAVELTRDEKAYAGLAHGLMIATWWIGPLVSFHAMQALFWQIIYRLLYIGGMILIFAAALGTMASMPQQKTADAPFPIELVVVMPLFWLIMMGGFVTSLTLGIIFCLKAMLGEWARYPVIGRCVERIVRN